MPTVPAFFAEYAAALADHVMMSDQYQSGLSERREWSGNLISDFVNLATSERPDTVGHVGAMPPEGFGNLTGFDPMGAAVLTAEIVGFLAAKGYDRIRKAFDQ